MTYLIISRRFLYESGLHKSWLAEMNTAFFITLFVTIRIGLGKNSTVIKDTYKYNLPSSDTTRTYIDIY